MFDNSWTPFIQSGVPEKIRTLIRFWIIIKPDEESEKMMVRCYPKSFFFEVYSARITKSVTIAVLNSAYKVIGTITSNRW